MVRIRSAYPEVAPLATQATPAVFRPQAIHRAPGPDHDRIGGTGGWSRDLPPRANKGAKGARKAESPPVRVGFLLELLGDLVVENLHR